MSTVCCRSNRGLASEPTELWQLAFDVVNAFPGPLRTDKSPASITAMVLRLSGELAEHLVGTEQLLDSHLELERLVLHLPAGPNQRGNGPNQWLLGMLATQTNARRSCRWSMPSGPGCAPTR